jgi:DNA repair exonuclease SbcCD ATPase subunit
VTAGSVGEFLRKRGCKTIRSERADRSARGRAVPAKFRKSVVFATKLGLVCLAVLIASGCGRYKEELESAKQQIDKLTAEGTRLAEVSANLEKEKTRLNDELKLLSDKTSKMEQQLGDLQKANASVQDEIGKVKKRNGELQYELSTLKKEKVELLRQVEDLTKSAAESVHPEKLPAPGPSETRAERSPKERIGTQRGNLAPCDAIVELMDKCLEIFKQHKEEERAKLLELIREEYASRIEGAPEKAIKAMEAWINELGNLWDSPKDDTVLVLVSKRKAVRAACGKNP